jgi:ubiquinone/menaquinone biosynthesis C-methylase UbiE
MKPGGFPISCLQYLRAPGTGRALSLSRGTPDAAGFVDAGTVTAEGGTSYAIQEGILRLLEPSTLAPAELKERDARDREAPAYDQRLSARHFREVVPFIAMADLHMEDIVLELACGTGRITRELAGKAGIVIASDFSFESLREAQRGMPAGSRAAFVEADAVSFPGVARAFSLIVSGQFIEHVPTPERRESFVRNAARMLAPFGRVALSAYHQDLRRRFAGLPQEGVHKTGIFFHYFSGGELKSLFRKAFEDVRISYLDVVLPGTAGLKLSERALGVLSRVWAQTPLSRFAHLAAVSARSPRASL